MIRRQRSKLLKRLKKAIYAYHASGTQRDAEIVTLLKEECIRECNRDVTTNTISEALWVIHNE